MLKVAIYIRKSTDSEDKQALSIEKQRTACDELLHGEDYEIVEVFEESITGTKSGIRPGFKKMLSLIQKGRVDCIVSWKMSRIARNPIEQAYIETFLAERKIQKIITQDGIFLPDDNCMMLRIYFGEATQYSRNLSKFASEGMRTKVKGGDPVKIPRGYHFDDKKKAIQNNDSVIIKEAFKLKREGFSFENIGQILQEKFGTNNNGKPLPSSSIQQIIKNPFYYGAIKYLGELYVGNHEPIITKKEYDEANNINASKRVKNDDPDTLLNPFKGFLENRHSGLNLSPFMSKGCLYWRSVDRTGQKVSFSWTRLDKYFSENIHKYNIPEELKQYAIEGFRDYFIEQSGRNNDSRDALNTEYKKLSVKLENATEMRLNGEFTPDEYSKKKTEIINRQIEINEELGKLQKFESGLVEKSERCFKLIVNLSQTYLSGNMIEKIEIIKMLCFRVFVDHEKALHLAERELFEICRNGVETVWLG